MTSQDDPKRRVLDHLKRAAPSTTRAVAQALQVSDVAARQHLFGLEGNGLVTKTAAAPAGKGRPGMLWKLTPLAHDLFPDRHDALTLELIEGVRSALGMEGLQRVVELRTQRQTGALTKRMARETGLRARLEALAAQRSEEGYMAEVVDAGDDGFLLVEHHCPICDAASACQLFCMTELELFQGVLGPEATVEREQHLLSGDERCVYRVRPVSAGLGT
ncbi:MAG: transcriptional regulator [Dehalococcoidia bacterium]|nr:transcriptional regulator [Dehalococcoidia bacterium]